MNGYRTAFFAITILLLCSCARVQVSQDYPPAADFSGIETFAWASDTQETTGDLRVDSPLLDTRIRSAVARVLGGKGWRQVPAAGAAIRVRYQFQINPKIAGGGPTTGVGYGVGTMGGAGGVVITSGGDIRSYDEGMLVIDLLRPPEGALIWRGTATFVMPEHPAPESTTDLINEAVEKTLMQFPPAAP